MDLVDYFCKICYTETKSIRNISTEKEQLKFILLSIMGNPNIINSNEIYACSSCCEELTRIDKIREKNYNSFLNFEQLSFQQNNSELQEIATKKLHNYAEIALKTGENSAKKSTVSDNHEEKIESKPSVKHIICTTERMNGQLGTNMVLKDDIKVEAECDGNVNTDMYENDRDTSSKIVGEQLETHSVFLKDNCIKYEVEYTEFSSSAIASLDDDRDDLKMTKTEVTDESDIHVNDSALKDKRDLTTKVSDDYNKQFCAQYNEDIKLHAEVDLDNSEEEAESMHVNDIDTTWTTEEESNSNMDILTEDSGSGRSTKTQGKKSYVCEYCNKHFKIKSHLDMHTRIHTGERPYKCNTCDQSFKQKGALVEHTRIHTGERPYKCSMCDRSFKRHDELVRHSRIHTGEKPYKCTRCDRSFAQKGTLVTHTQTHTGERPHKCNTCDRTFKRKYDMVTHTLVHTGERPYKCNTCDRSFTVKSKLVKHERTHTVERPYKCSICDKSFKQENTLVEHKRIHTGEKPYKCHTCNQSFTAKSTYVKHIRIHTRDRTWIVD